MLPTCYQHVANMLPTCCRRCQRWRRRWLDTKMLPTCCRHVADMLPTCCRHVADMLPTCCRHVANMLPTLSTLTTSLIGYWNVADMLSTLLIGYWNVADMLPTSLFGYWNVADMLPTLRILTLSRTPSGLGPPRQQLKSCHFVIKNNCFHC